jgi:O-antigen/teichoic acid export membrane protein
MNEISPSRIIAQPSSLTAVQNMRTLLGGHGLFARALRSSAWTGAGHILSQIIRLASNLVLTRLLFPEAFGLMSLVTVLMIGVAMLSDVGIGVSISQSRRGDDPKFLDTAWSMQILRGLMIFVLVTILAWPFSLFYSEPSLVYLVPVASLSVLIASFNPIRLETAGRHLMLGRVVLLDLLSQIGSILVTIACVMIYPSVWALVIGLILGAVIRLTLANLMLPGKGSRFCIDPSAAREILHLGKWIILSTAFGYMLGQGDRLVLGFYLSLEKLGIYNIGQFLAAAPLVLSLTIGGKVLIPVYREYLDSPEPQTARKLRLMRCGLTGMVLAMLFVIILISEHMVSFLYDDRYAEAAAIVVMIALGSLSQAVGLTYDRGSLAAGDSRTFFVVVAFRGSAQTAALIVGAELAGLFGALVALGISGVLGHLALIWLARRHGIWDPLHDLAFTLLSILFGALAIHANWDLLHGFYLFNSSPAA